MWTLKNLLLLHGHMYDCIEQMLRVCMQCGWLTLDLLSCRKQLPVYKARQRFTSTLLVEHSLMRCSGLPPQEAPVMIAEKRKLFFFFFFY